MENFIERARAVHGERFDYSRTVYRRAHAKVEIICKKHGPFMQDPMAHLKGFGCAKCCFDAAAQRNEQVRLRCATEFVEKAMAIHGNRFDYSQSHYLSATDKIKIGCPEHGVFEITAANHLSGRGCPRCGKKRADDSKRKSNNAFVDQAMRIHEGRYSYAASKYVSSALPVQVICSEHGAFEITPSNHLKGKGCPTCAVVQRASSLVSNKGAVFIERARAIHGDKYDYSKAEYLGASDNLIITCPTHGDFEQSPSNHLHIYRPTGCPKCAGIGPSKGEREVFEFIKALCPDAVQSVRGELGDGRELDIVIPSKGLAVEFNGLIWHSSKYGKARDYHQQKSDAATVAGYRLIHIWGDEWDRKREWCEAFLRMQLVGPERKFHARKCRFKAISSTVAMPFHDAFHLQGRKGGSNIGVFSTDGELLAVATVQKGELARWTVKFDVVIVGALSKVIRMLDRPIFSFCDTAKHSGSGYLSAGFKLIGSSAPTYHYTDGFVRRNRVGFQKHKLRGQSSVEGSTEKEMAESIGFYQIGGCRQLKFLWEPDTIRRTIPRA